MQAGLEAEGQRVLLGGKIASNAARDARNIALLREAGWQVMEVWECDVRKGTGLEEKLLRFLEG
jgi:DNA mismatch endonuclease (patch repair protein)